ncbi:hypothetical protein [Pseudomonas caricapapayae]|uniref:hypothetical protein n=1 Tax=Pseudomonas caricapapayae TaxID=46678 RepID=UPI0011C36970|nr:hypothetical protein [Pseudomonas caricapapayae]
MRNPFFSLTNKKDKSKYYAKVYDSAATDALGAMARYNGLTRTILDHITVAMDAKNECMVDLQDMDAAFRINTPAVRTKALNLLRMMNVIETSTSNRTGITSIRVNFRVYCRDVENELAKGKGFNEPLNLSILDSDGFIIEEEIKKFKARKPKKVDLMSDIDKYLLD